MKYKYALVKKVQLNKSDFPFKFHLISRYKYTWDNAEQIIFPRPSLAHMKADEWLIHSSAFTLFPFLIYGVNTLVEK